MAKGLLSNWGRRPEKTVAIFFPLILAFFAEPSRDRLERRVRSDREASRRAVSRTESRTELIEPASAWQPSQPTGISAEATAVPVVVEKQGELTWN